MKIAFPEISTKKAVLASIQQRCNYNIFMLKDGHVPHSNMAMCWTFKQEKNAAHPLRLWHDKLGIPYKPCQFAQIAQCPLVIESTDTST